MSPMLPNPAIHAVYIRVLLGVRVMKEKKNTLRHNCVSHFPIMDESYMTGSFAFRSSTTFAFHFRCGGRFGETNRARPADPNSRRKALELDDCPNTALAEFVQYRVVYSGEFGFFWARVGEFGASREH